MMDIDLETERFWLTETARRPPQISHPKQAYVFLMTNDKLMTMLFTLEASFKDMKSTRRRIVLSTNKVSQKARKTLVKLAVELRDI